ncbi:hypothetical protein CcaverHIS002_0409780 [Cutaneotrichosporon cavernicola]|uniref:Uncharacterized protein n=1 Tax=Cutaneotrichosporon cavernicola TaxID=279322 RepID=A0AA48L567_9TREE|nr:uncharacterized protein CcaverHIS019_0409700 [Cutaneotrichosporon cavernicola]BEI84374.1 hypothetical protein CcaverHIS002_0409780 [Cutaneotrichosporon cavernicola]BEI92150.1 hypothetical protein CcaverHIS019_0409700 [Cutaneotrichosporon cavernicola]BEI99920.1 hypothetical protein CcaverHIS631_0409630 [Cutaneotrichosporon cavernicola]BEJ07695.1 hypothetical protein CcaverHIS641_0409640 [Cutaneotrichosporon cavernicola]
MASGWDTPRLRQRPAFLTPGPTQPVPSASLRDVEDHAQAGPSPWPKTPSIPWYDRYSPSSATPSSVGPSARSAPSGVSGHTTSSTIQYLRLAFQETPPKLKELEEGWRIARRAASRPAPVVVVERIGGKSERHARELYEHRPELGTKRGADRIRPPHDPPAAVPADKGKQRAVLDEHSVGQSTGLLTPPESPAPRAALARQRPKGTPRPLVRFVSPPPPSEPESGPSGWSGPSCPSRSTSGPSQPSRSSQPSSTPTDDTPTPTLRLTIPTLRVMSATMPHEIPPSVVSDPTPPFTLPDLPLPPPARLAVPEPTRPASATSRPARLSPPRPTRRTSLTPPNPESKVLEPILVQHLPLTRHPEPLSRKSSDAIVVHSPSASVALTLNYRRLTANVNRAGDEVTIEGRAPQVLRLAESASWAASQRSLWQLVDRLVTDYKRRTPRIKVFTPLGELVVTCCEPPDIVLSYLDANDATTKVRLRYSLSLFEAVLDTSTHKPRGTRDETHRARRSIPLSWSGQGERAALALGVDFSDWESAEKDAVRRLWSLREDWARFVPGYNH